MNKETFSTRLQEAMRARKIKQVDLVEKTLITSDLINKYIKGRAIARPNNLSLLAKSLNVSEPWLMGYDVPMNKETIEEPNLFDNTVQQSDILEHVKVAMHRNEYTELTDEDKKEIINFAKYVAEKRKNMKE
ncbi:MAG: helix-turn-helix domain-containing protein [Oscillospiraceae bacterium]|nr:helix-turn-helix domain-containing protein [Oscillospiraceae bacterium]